MNLNYACNDTNVNEVFDILRMSVDYLLFTIYYLLSTCSIIRVYLTQILYTELKKKHYF